MVLERNPLYHGRFSGNVQQVKLLFSNDWPGSLALYESDRLDVFFTTGLAAPDKDRVRERHPDEFIAFPRFLTFSVVFDVTRAPFDDPRVRRAFVLATDRQGLADAVAPGLTLPVTGGLIPPGMVAHSPGIGLPYDPQQARRLLVAAGYPSGRGFPAVELLMPAAPSVMPQGEYLQAHWRQNLGVEIRWGTQEWALFRDQIRSDPPHLRHMAWQADYPDPDTFLRVAVGLETEWRDESYESLVEEARRIMDQTRRMELYRQADRILIEEAALMPIFHSRMGALIKPWVKRYYSTPLGGMFWKEVVIEPH